MKLYTVTTIVKEYAGCRSVPFIWFRHRPEAPKRPYAELIENYKGEGDHAYAEHHVEELLPRVGRSNSGTISTGSTARKARRRSKRCACPFQATRWGSVQDQSAA